MQKSTVTMTAELTVEQKLADGFRITYAVRKADYTGDPRTAALIEAVRKTLENLVVHATTASNGKPLRVDNLAEVQAVARKAIDDLSAPADGKSEEAAMLRQMATAMQIADDQHAPSVYLASLASLALGQNTGLHPGETRRNDDDVVNPFGVPIKSNTLLRIDSADPATGKVRYISTRTFDADALRAFLGGLAQRLAGVSQNAPAIDNMMKQLAMTLDSRTEIDVEDGMTRSLREVDKATAGTPGRNIVKHGYRLMTVTRVP